MLFIARNLLTVAINSSFCICMFAPVGIGQEPAAEPRARTPAEATGPAGTVRLVYELPVDELQRTLQQHSGHSMEQLLTDAIDSITTRLGTDAKVARDGAAGFTIEVQAPTPVELAKVRRRVELLGTLELRLLATETYPEVDLQLHQERQRLEAWLANGGLDQVRKDPSSFATFEPAHPERIRWVVRQVDPKNKASNYLISNRKAGQPATLTTFSPEEWRTPPDNFGHMLEIVAINRHARSFSGQDLDTKHARVDKGRMMTSASYYLRADLKQDYTDWCKANEGQCCAVLLNGELITAPVLRSRNGARGMIAGNFDQQLADDLAMALRSSALPAAPRLLRQETVPAKSPKPPSVGGKSVGGK